MLMVKAKRNGIYDNTYRYVGDKFEISGDNKFSMHWMERMSKEEVKEAEAKAEAIKQAKQLVLDERKKVQKDRDAARQADRESNILRNKEYKQMRADMKSNAKSNK